MYADVSLKITGGYHPHGQSMQGVPMDIGSSNFPAPPMNMAQPGGMDFDNMNLDSIPPADNTQMAAWFDTDL